MNTLHLVLKGKWYDMIDRGEKKEEYREIKPYWEKRLLDYKKLSEWAEKNIMLLRLRQVFFPSRTAIENVCRDFPRGYTHICFHKGYTSTTMTFTVESIKMGEGNPEWGAPTDRPVFIKTWGEIMTREIKFRGKRIDTGKWVYGSLLQWKDGDATICANESENNNVLIKHDVNPDTVGQYTGLKDRDGKEIYEGDIVKTPLLDPIFGDMLSDAFDNVAISFHNGSFVVAYYNGRHKIYLQDLYDEIEVIGNIHDNPELLEERK